MRNSVLALADVLSGGAGLGVDVDLGTSDLVEWRAIAGRVGLFLALHDIAMMRRDVSLSPESVIIGSLSQCSLRTAYV